MEMSDLAGQVRVEVVADLKPLERGLAEARQKAGAADKDLAGAFKGASQSAKQFGQDVEGAAKKAAGGFTFLSREETEARLGLKSAGSAARSAGAGIQVAGAAALAAGSGGFKLLDEKADAARNGLSHLLVESHKVSGALQVAGAAAQAAGAGMGGGVAATDALSSSSSRAVVNTAALTQATRLFGLALSTVATLALTAGTAIGAVFTLDKFIQETIKSEQEQTKLAAALRATGEAAGKSIGDLNAHADALASTTAFAGGAITSAQTLLLTFDKIRGDNFERATEAALDMSAAIGTDLSSAAMRVGRALQDPVVGLEALRRQGIQLSAGQKQTIKDMVAVGDAAGAQEIILRELEQRYGSTATAIRGTMGGALRALAEAWNSTFALNKNASEPLRLAIEDLITAIKNPAFQQFVETIGTLLFQALTTAVGGAEMLISALGLLNGAIGPLTTAVGVLIGYKFAAWALLAVEGITGLVSTVGLAAAASGVLTTAMGALGSAARIAFAVLSRINLPAALLTAVAAAAWKVYENFGLGAKSASEYAAAQDLVNEALGRSIPATQNATQEVIAKTKADLEAARAMLQRVEAELEYRKEIKASVPQLPGAPDPLVDVNARLAKVRENADSIGRTLQALMRGASSSVGALNGAINDTALVFDIATEGMGKLGNAAGAAASGIQSSTAGIGGSFSSLGQTVNSATGVAMQAARTIGTINREALASTIGLKDQLDATQIQLQRYRNAITEAKGLSVADVMGDAADINAANAALRNANTEVAGLFDKLTRGAISPRALWQEIEKLKQEMHAVAGAGNSVDPFIEGLIKAYLNSQNLEEQVKFLSRAITGIPNRMIDIVIREHTVRTTSGGSANVNVIGMVPGGPMVKNDGSIPAGVSGGVSYYPGNTGFDPFGSGVGVYRSVPAPTSSGAASGTQSTGGGIISYFDDPFNSGVNVFRGNDPRLSSMSTSGANTGGSTGLRDTISTSTYDALTRDATPAEWSMLTPQMRMNIYNRGTGPGGTDWHQQLYGTRAAGGSVTAGDTYLVGEQGPEIVSMGASGSVSSASSTANILAGGRDRLTMIEENTHQTVEQLRRSISYLETIENDGQTTNSLLREIKSAISSSPITSSRSGGSSGGFSSGGGSGNSATTYDFNDPKAPYHYRPNVSAEALGSGGYDALADFMYNGNYGALGKIAQNEARGIGRSMTAMGTPIPEAGRLVDEFMSKLIAQGPSLGTYGGDLTFSSGGGDFLSGSGFFGEGGRLRAGGMGQGIGYDGTVLAQTTANANLQRTLNALGISDAERSALGFYTGGAIHPGDTRKIEAWSRPDEAVAFFTPQQMQAVGGAISKGGAGEKKGDTQINVGGIHISVPPGTDLTDPRSQMELADLFRDAIREELGGT